MRPGVDKNPIDIIATLPLAATAGAFIVNDPRGTGRYFYIGLANASFWRLDSYSWTLQRLPNIPAPLVFGAGTCATLDVSSGLLYVFGAGVGGGVDAETYSFNTTTNVWTALDALNDMDGFLGAVWASDGALVHPCSTIAFAASNDFIYMCGNKSLNTFQYTISTDRWTRLPPANRAVTGGNGVTMTWNWSVSVDAINSIDGDGVATMEHYGIAGNAWAADVPVPLWTTNPDTGTCACPSTDGARVYIRLNATGRIYEYSPLTKAVTPLATMSGTDGAASVGGKLVAYTVGGKEYLVLFQHGGMDVQRIRIVR